MQSCKTLDDSLPGFGPRVLRRYVRVKGEPIKAGESSKVNRDWTICRPCRLGETDPTRKTRFHHRPQRSSNRVDEFAKTIFPSIRR